MKKILVLALTPIAVLTIIILALGGVSINITDTRIHGWLDRHGYAFLLVGLITLIAYLPFANLDENVFQLGGHKQPDDADVSTDAATFWSRLTITAILIAAAFARLMHISRRTQHTEEIAAPA